MALNWPSHFDRTPADQRRRRSPYQVSLADAVADLETELERLDPDTWTADTGNTHTKSNGMPLYNANPDDPGFVLRWMMDDENFAVACDNFTGLRDNLRTVGLWVNETRMRAKRPVETGDVAFAAARLPPGDEDAIAAEPPAHAILGVEPDATPEEIQSAFREQAKDAHADTGGSDDEMKRLILAKEEALGNR